MQRFVKLAACPQNVVAFFALLQLSFIVLPFFVLFFRLSIVFRLCGATPRTQTNLGVPWHQVMCCSIIKTSSSLFCYDPIVCWHVNRHGCMAASCPILVEQGESKDMGRMGAMTRPQFLQRLATICRKHVWACHISAGVSINSIHWGKPRAGATTQHMAVSSIHCDCTSMPVLFDVHAKRRQPILAIISTIIWFVGLFFFQAFLRGNQISGPL